MNDPAARQELAIVGVLLAVLLLWWAAARFGPARVIIFATGASAGFLQFQVHRLHVFTLLTVLCLLAGVPKLRAAPMTYVFKYAWVLGAAGLMAATAYFDALPATRNLSLQLIALALSACLTGLLFDGDRRRLVLLGLLTACTVSGGAAILQTIHVLPHHLIQLANAETGRPSGLQPEPDWVGMFGMVGVIVAWREVLRNRWRIALILVNLAALALSQTRGALIALAVVGVLALIFSRGDKTPHGRRRNVSASAAVLVAVIAFVEAFPAEVTKLNTRVGSLLGHHAANSSILTRQLEQHYAFQLLRTAPWRGLGLTADARASSVGINYGAVPLHQSTGSDWLLGMWIDGKVLALPLIALMAWFAFTRIRTTASLILLGVLVSSLFSNAFFFPITWFALGMCLQPLRVKTRPAEWTSGSLDQDAGRVPSYG